MERRINQRSRNIVKTGVENPIISMERLISNHVTAQIYDDVDELEGDT